MCLVSGGIGSSVTTEEPTDPSNGDLWWNTADNTLYIWYEDGDTGQWVISVPQGSGSGNSDEYVSKTDTASQKIVSDLTLNSDKITLDATDGTATFAGDVVMNTVTVGRGAGDVETNTAVGKDALLNNTTGFVNTAVGKDALNANTEGFANTAVGEGALEENTEGNYHTAVGQSALLNNTTGSNNVAVGNNSLYDNPQTHLSLIHISEPTRPY